MAHSESQGQKGKVRFIRKNGRVIPIRSKGAGRGPPSQKARNKRLLSLQGDKNKKRRVAIVSSALHETSKRDARLARTGRKVAAFSAGTSIAASGALFAFNKKLSKTKLGRAGAIGLVATAGLGALSALVNTSFASGRSNSAKMRRKAAQQIGAGKKLKVRGGIGPAPDQARKDIAFGLVFARGSDKQRKQIINRRR